MAGKETNGVALAINFPPQTEKETGSIKAVQSLGGPTLAKEVVIHEKVEAAVPAKEEKCDTQLEGVAELVKEEKDDRFGNQPTVTLNSGRKMPLLGTGTACFPLPPIEDLKKAILDAMEVGYRHFDSAAAYQSEEGLGVAIAEALEKGLIKSRDELFITTKLWCNNACPERVLPAIRESLRKLRLEYVDLYLIHFPARFKEEILEMPCVKDDILPLDMKSTWEAMEEVNKLGLAKSIGVSNFTCKKLTDLLAHAKIPPAVNQVGRQHAYPHAMAVLDSNQERTAAKTPFICNLMAVLMTTYQVEMHPVWQQKKLRDFYAEKGIHVSAYSPLGAKEWGFDVVLGNALLIDIARAKGKGVAQIALRWGFQQGVSLVPKSFNKGRLKQNFAILDWQLTEEELQQIGTIPQKRIMITPEFIFPDGIFKSPEELWDGEM